MENHIGGGEFHGPVVQARTVGELHLHAGPTLAANQLADYLRAAAQAAAEHPYPAVFPGVVPPLARIHLRQVARPYSSSSHPAASGHPPVPADEMLGSTADLTVVVAEPGGGKSSLLRMHLARVCGRWLRGERREALPVLVHASAVVTGPLADCLAKAVNADLPGLVEVVPPEFFRQPPAPGEQWLVLLDGLDELPELRDQELVLRQVLAWQQSHADRYHFVLTSRPLPDRLLQVLGEGTAIHELQSFGLAEIEEVATRWFHAFGLTQPEAAAEQFLAAIQQAGLTALAGAPLMIAMLCQLHAASPAERLPASRGALYERFVDLLRERRRPTGPTVETLARHGPAAVAAADRVLGELQEHLAAIAHHLLFAEQGARAVLDLLLAERVTAPARVPRGEWQAFLASAVLSTGLLTATAGGYATAHRSMLEFLAAQHATGTPAARDAELRRAFRAVRHRGLRAPKGIRPRTGRWRPCRCPELPDSYLGFVIDAAPEQAARYLGRLASGSAGQYGCWFIVDQSRLGTDLPAGLVATALRELRFEGSRRSRPPMERVVAAVATAEMWTELGDPRGAEVLAGLAANQRIRYADRAFAAEALAAIGDARGIDGLHTLLVSPERVWAYRRVVAKRLAEAAGSERAVSAFRQAIAHPSIKNIDRVFLAIALTKTISIRAGSEELYALAIDLDAHPFDRAYTAHELAVTAGDPRGVQLLRAIVAGPGLRARLLAISYLSRCPGGAEALRELATDSGLPRLVRWAARRSARWGTLGTG
ncbi:NACHT domain-containing protein [Kitasatospora sp. LaBMicrA B282]|uniref:NACHT domain-containing protein n=1 Tax=Kitasatospora sp. LaBMicrA B282 TaxID=3420949 RepID=UPI003D142905